ncbi:MAG: hypothetical protein HRU82_02655 [Nitrospira sp.]|nr:MAG: hypothetical protein HRU82_02655 [Nitrospira sp.]
MERTHHIEKGADEGMPIVGYQAIAQVLSEQLADAQATIAALQGQVREYLEQIELLRGMLVSYRREVDSLRTQLANTAEGTEASPTTAREV